MYRLKVREVAESKGFNISTLSRASNVPFSTVRRVWKDPYREIKLTTLAKLAETLGVATSELIEDVQQS